MGKKYTQKEIIEASRLASTDLNEGRLVLPTEHREIRIIQSGNWNPYENIQEARKYRLNEELLKKYG
ncbi:MAG: hypothetical protein ACRCZO_10880, partial [Cetobacterium sp.]